MSNVNYRLCTPETVFSLVAAAADGAFAATGERAMVYVCAIHSQPLTIASHFTNLLHGQIASDNDELGIALVESKSAMVYINREPPGTTSTIAALILTPGMTLDLSHVARFGEVCASKSVAVAYLAKPEDKPATTRAPRKRKKTDAS